MSSASPSVFRIAQILEKIGKYVVVNEVAAAAPASVYLSHDAYYGP